MELKVSIKLQTESAGAESRRFRRPFAAGRVADVPAGGSRRAVEPSAADRSADSGEGAR